MMFSVKRGITAVFLAAFLIEIIIIIIIISFIFLRVHQLFCNIADTVSIRINNTLSTQMVQSYAARGAKKEGLS